MKNYIVGEKVVTGEWDGEEISRKRTAQEVLLQMLQKAEKDAREKVKQNYAIT